MPTVWRTRDRGASWVDVTPVLPPAAAAQSRLGAQEVRAWFLGSRAWVTVPSGSAGAAEVQLYRTADWGRTWQHWEAHLPISSAITVRGIDFTDSRHGWLLVAAMPSPGSPDTSVALLTTADGGSTWRMIHTWRGGGISGLPHGVAFASPHRGWLTVSGGRLLATRDGGRSWHAESLRLPKRLLSWTTGNGSTVPNMRLVGTGVPRVFLPGGHGVLPVDMGDETSADSFTRLGLFVTTDGGARWTYRSEPWKGGLGWVDFVDPHHGWIWGEGWRTAATQSVPEEGHLYSTQDGGRTWTALPIGAALHTALCTAGNLVQLDFASPAVGWALLRKPQASGTGTGALLMTRDGGRNWVALQ